MKKRIDDIVRIGKDLFNANTWASFALWFILAVGMAVLLIWFLGFSGFGAPAAPVYEGF